MSWFNTLENGISSLFHPRQTSQPNDAPIKSLIKNAPTLPAGPLADNARMKQQLLDGTFKKGGPVKKTGIYQLHKGEYVLNKKKAMAAKMNDSDSLREYSRTDAEGKKYYRMPEGTYKRNGDRYEREDRQGGAVIHG